MQSLLRLVVVEVDVGRDRNIERRYMPGAPHPTSLAKMLC